MKQPVTTQGQIAEHIGAILFLLGQDLAAEGLKDTPDRVARFLVDFLEPHEFAPTSFTEDDVDQMQVVSGIKEWSLCEHHMLPFSITAHVGYIPQGRIIGLSKVPRIVRYYARRLQTQERLTAQIARHVNDVTGALGVICVLEGHHTCVAMRGVERDVTFQTSSLVGCFQDDLGARQEFLSLIRRGSYGG